MTDEIIASPDVEQAPQPAIEVEEPVETPQDIDPVETEEDPETVDEAVEEDEEVEWNGKTFKAPKGLKDGILMQADYTKKTQDVSTKAKELEARETELKQQAEATDEELTSRAQLVNIEDRLSQYGKLTQADWDAYYAQDYVETDKAWRDYQFLKAQRGEIAETLKTKQTERTQKAELDLANRVEATNKFASEKIKGYTPELTTKLVEFASNEGLDEKTLKTNWSPTLYKLLHKAYIGEQTLKQQATPKPKVAATVAPLVTVKTAGTSAPVKSLAALADANDMAGYIAARSKGRG